MIHTRIRNFNCCLLAGRKFALSSTKTLYWNQHFIPHTVTLVMKPPINKTRQQQIHARSGYCSSCSCLNDMSSAPISLFLLTGNVLKSNLVYSIYVWFPSSMGFTAASGEQSKGSKCSLPKKQIETLLYSPL